jgi:hypothetical protein
VNEPLPDQDTESAGNDKGRWRRWAMIAAMAAALVLSSLSSVDRVAEREYQTLFERALITFALARTLNGLISAVQGTELALQPAGVGVTLTPGEILDPVNDLVERFSWIMLGATLSLGVQQVLLDIGQWWGVKVLLAVAGLAWLAFRLKREREGRGSGESFETFLARALVLMLFIRFAVPLAMIANEAVYEVFLEARFTESTRVIESAGAGFEHMNAGSVPAEAGGETEQPGFFDAIGDMFDSTAESMDFQAKLDYIQERASELIEHLLQLGVVFIFQTGILPIAFLWLFLQLFKRILRN